MTAWEALFGQRPFAGSKLLDVSSAIIDGRITEPPADRGIPRHVRRALERGLSTDPTMRWPSMEALLAELARDPRARLTRVAAMLGIGGAVAAAFAWGTRDGPCDDSSTRLAGVWNSDTRSSLAAAFDAAAGEFERSARMHVSRRLDDYAEARIEGHAEACRATHVRAEQSDRVLDLRMACPDDRRRSLSALVDVLLRADAAAVERAVDAVSALDPIAPCSDLAYLEARIKPPEDPEVAAAVEAIRQELATIRTLLGAGKTDEAREAARAAFTHAEALGYEPLLAEVGYEDARLEKDPHQAATRLREVYFLERGCNHDEVAKKAAIQLVGTFGLELTDIEASLDWADHARAELKRNPSDRDMAELERELGGSLREAGRFDDAEAHLRSALDRLSPDDPFRAHVLASLANVLSASKRYDEAEAIYLDTLEAFRTSFGDSTTSLASTTSRRCACSRPSSVRTISSSPSSSWVWPGSIWPHHGTAAPTTRPDAPRRPAPPATLHRPTSPRPSSSPHEPSPPWAAPTKPETKPKQLSAPPLPTSPRKSRPGSPLEPTQLHGRTTRRRQVGMSRADGYLNHSSTSSSRTPSAQATPAPTTSSITTVIPSRPHGKPARGSGRSSSSDTSASSP